MPGSHNLYRASEESDWEKIKAEAVALAMPPRGSMAFRNAQPWHGSLPRTQDGLWVGGHMMLISERLRPWQQFSRPDLDLDEMMLRSPDGAASSVKAR